jgi:capsular exopolysaccharide synthesis family protein
MESPIQHPEIPHTQKLTRRRDVINIDYLFSLAKRYWYLFIISAPIALAWVFVSLRYAIPQYQASCTMVIKGSEARTPSGSYIIEGIGLSPEDKNIETQIFTMQSFRMSRMTIERLDFGIEYYSDGRFKDFELYQQTPFTVQIDSAMPHVLNVPVGVKMVGGGYVDVTVNTEGAAMFDLVSQKTVGATGEVVYKQRIKVGEKTTTPFGTIAIVLNSNNASNLEYYYLVRSIDAIASEYRSRLNIGSLREGTSIVSISVAGKTPLKLLRFLDEFCEVVQEQNLAQKNEIADQSLLFINRQLQSIADTLERTQDVLLRFKQENGFMTPDLASEQISQDFLAAEKSKREINLKQGYFNNIKAKLINDAFTDDFMLPAFSDDNVPIITQMITSIIEVNRELQSVKQMGEYSPLLTALNEKNKAHRQELLLLVDKLLESLELNEQVINNEIGKYERMMSLLPDLEKRYLNIDRKYKLNDAIYTFLLQKNSEMQISKASNTSDNSVVDQAYVTGVISPTPGKNYQRALMLGLVIPVGLIALIEFLNVKIRSKEDIEALVSDTPVIGVVPQGKVGGRVIVVDNPRSFLAESFRTLRTRLNFMGSGGQATVFTITSTNSGDGKTFIATNLSTVFALSGKKTIVLGFDLRKPKLNDSFNLNHTKGISNYLIGEVEAEEVCFPTDINGLYVMPSGEIPPNPSELIGMQRTALLFQWLRANFEIIIVDSPPIGVVSDARMLMHYSDTQLYVVRSNHTRKDHLQLTMSGLYSEKVHGVGIVFNGVQMAASTYGSYYHVKDEV